MLNGTDETVQEREIEKVNAFYLQKEQEVWPHSAYHMPLLQTDRAISVHSAFEDISRQEASHPVPDQLQFQSTLELRCSV